MMDRTLNIKTTIIESDTCNDNFTIMIYPVDPMYPVAKT